MSGVRAAPGGGVREEQAADGALAEVRGLTADADGAALLRGVDLSVRAGAVTALVGPSGSGKTTTALALLGESAPGVRLAGSVRVGGTPVVDADGPTSQAPQVRGGVVAYMPQHPGSALNPARRTGAVLTELAGLHGKAAEPEAPVSRSAARAAARAGAVAALEAAQLPVGDDGSGAGVRGVLRRFPHQFSGGQRQRVALAQVLACGPRVLVLDEPGTGLDTVTRMSLARELAALARGGLAVLLLSHDHDMVRALADHVVLLEGGRVAGEGPPERVLPAPPTEPAEPSAAETGAEEPAEHVQPSESAASSEREGGAAGGCALDVHGLTAWLRPGGRQQVLDEVSLALPAGGCVALAGRSGSGKTTLARCLAGLHERWRGQILLDGAPLPVLRRRDAETTRRVQYVWQEVRGSFDERRGVLAQVARTAVRLRGVPAGQAAREAAELLERLGVAPETAERRPDALSGGELQRAAFARAVLARPDVLVCDEVTTALDGAATERVVAEVRRLRREEGTAVLWIGHDLGLIRTVAGGLVVLDGGRVAEAGDCRAVLRAPAAESTRMLLRAERIGTGRPAPADEPNGAQEPAG